MKFYVMTDLHYYSKTYWHCDPYSAQQINDQLQLLQSEEIIRTAYQMALEDEECEFVAICGDVTNNGEPNSHSEFYKLTKEYADKGLKIYLITASHDFSYRGELSYAYDIKAKRIPTIRKVSRSTLKDLYFEFGPRDAIAYEPDSMSFIVQVDDKVRLLMINDDNPGNRNNCFSEEVFDFITEQLILANADGQKVICCTHHPVLSPSPAFKAVSARDLYMLSDGKIQAMADLGAKVVFTGHSHIQDVDSLTTNEGAWIYNITTGALTGFPPVMRKVDYNPDTNVIDIKTITVRDPETCNLRGLSLTEFAKENFIGYIENLFESASRDYKQFAILARDFSMSYQKAMTLKPIVQPLAKYMDKLTFGKVWKSTRKFNGLTRAEVDGIFDERVEPLIFDCIVSLFAGDASYPTDGAEYKLTVAFIAVIDNLLATLHVPLKKMMSVDKLHYIVAPLMHNHGFSDNNITIDLSVPPERHEPLPPPETNKGRKIAIAVIFGAIVLSPVILVVAVLLSPVLLIRKTKKRKPHRPPFLDY